MAKLTRIGVGPRLCEAVIHGDMIYLSGQVGYISEVLCVG